MFRPGDTIQIWTGCYWHLGIYVGNDNVIHAVKLYRSEYVFQVVCTSLRDFAGDNVVYINNAIASNDRAADIAAVNAGDGGAEIQFLN